MSGQRILVIRLGALGDLILCCPAFQAIRKAYPDARIALLTMPDYAAFAQQMPWFDDVLVDERAPGWRLDCWLDLLRQVRSFAPTRVYDLQGKTRQSILYALLGGPFSGPEWSGAAPGCSHPRLWPPLPGMHFANFIGAQLAKGGVPSMPPADFSWLHEDPGIDTARRYVLLIPGCGPGRGYKRWPASFYAELAHKLQAQGLAALAIGTAADRDAIRALCEAAPATLNLCGKTSLAQLATLARGAMAAVGNDTGPTHLCAAVGAPTLALLSLAVDSVWSTPRGPKTAMLQANLAELDTEQVWLALGRLTAHNPPDL